MDYQPLVAKVHCPSCDREWLENVFAEEHTHGGSRTCPFPDCLRLGIIVSMTFRDSGKRTLREDF